MAQTLPVFPSFDVHNEPASIAQRWTKYVKRFTNLMVAMNIKDKKRQRALLLHYAGEDVSDMLDTLADTGEEIDSALDERNAYFNPKKNIDYETYVFRQTEPSKGETMDAFATRLTRQLTVTCDFNDVEREIKGQIIQGCSSNRRDPTMTLTNILDMARALEQSETQTASIENSTDTKTEMVNHVNKPRQNYKKKSTKYTAKRPKQPSLSQSSQSHTLHKTKKCKYCGYAYLHPEGKTCPAKGKECGYCHKLNHFESECRLKRKANKESVKQLHILREATHDHDSSTDEEYVFGPHATSRSTSREMTQKQPVVTVNINGHSLLAVIDTGATVNMVSEATFNELSPPPTCENKHCPDIFSYNTNQPLQITGRFTANVSSGSNLLETAFYITPGSCDTLLSYKTCIDLKLLNLTQQVNQLTQLTTT